MEILIGKANLTTWVSSLIERWHVPGLTLSVLQDGELRYSRAFGLADIEHNVPMTEGTQMPLSSMTKPFISNIAAILVERGLLDWDTPVKKYLPFFQMSSPSVAEAATIRDFLSMRTGLMRDDGHVVDQIANLSLEDVVRKAPDVKCVSPFRSRMIYSNMSICIAALVLEKVAGKKWYDILRDEVLTPLGMNSTTFTYKEALATNTCAISYHWKQEAFVQATWASWEKDVPEPTGTVCTTLTDLTTWTGMLLAHGKTHDGQILSQATLSDMWSPHSITHEHDIVWDFCPEAYGLTWGLRKYRGYPMVYHRGTHYGFRTSVTMIPEKNLGVVVQANGNGRESFLPHLITISLFDAILERNFFPWEPLVKAYIAAFSKEGA